MSSTNQFLLGDVWYVYSNYTNRQVNISSVPWFKFISWRYLFGVKLLTPWNEVGHGYMMKLGEQIVKLIEGNRRETISFDLFRDRIFLYQLGWSRCYPVRMSGPEINYIILVYLFFFSLFFLLVKWFVILLFWFWRNFKCQLFVTTV